MGIFDFLKNEKNPKRIKELDERAFKTLIEYLEKIPSMTKPISFGSDDDGFWWVKFQLDITNELAWNIYVGSVYMMEQKHSSMALPSTSSKGPLSAGTTTAVIAP